MASLVLAAAGIVATALAVLPGALGVLKFTHRWTARPAIGYFNYVVAGPLWGAGVLLGVAALYVNPGATRLVPLAALGTIAMLSGFGFLMHTRFMFRPVRNPEYIPVDEAVRRFGPEEEVAGVVDSRGTPVAFVTRLARRPHVVFHRDRAGPFMLTHCVLSHSSMAYALNGDYRTDDIYISSVLANNLVFYDRTNHCSVLQIANRSTDGARALPALPTVMTTLGTWQRLYPSSRVWIRPREWRDTFYLKLLARATVVDQNSPDLVYPLERPPDPRLPLKAYVMGVGLHGEAKAYPADAFRHLSVLEDVVGGEPMVFFAAFAGDYVQLFSRRHASGRTLTFAAGPDGTFRDAETGSVWTCTGESVGGALAGSRLTPLAHYSKVFWCVWADFFPGTILYDPGERAG